MLEANMLGRGPTGYFQIQTRHYGAQLMLVKEARLSVVTSQFARALILLLVCTAQTAHAQVTVDVSKITCEQFIVLPKADSVAIWLSGYYNGDRHTSMI